MLEPLGVHAPVIIQNMCIPLCYHRCLRMAGIALDTIDVAATEHQFVGGTGVTDTVKDHLGQIVFRNQFAEQPLRSMTC